MLKGIDNLQSLNYNAYNRINEKQAQQLVQKNDGRQEPSVNEAAKEPKEAVNIDLRLGDIHPRKNASLEDISLSLNEARSFDLKGRDSDIESLDIEKAVSDMQKDQALMQYQYFVGDTNIMGNEDGIVIPK